MNEMVKLIEQFELKELFNKSRLKGVRFFKSSSHIPRSPLLYDPGIFIVAQGRKIGHLGERSFQYDPNNYLVTSVPIPFECETFADADAPFLGLYVDIDMPVLHELMGLLGQSRVAASVRIRDIPKGVAPAEMDAAMHDAVIRLLKCLHSEADALVLGPGLIREIIYRALCGTQASSLYALAAQDGSFARVSKTLHLIHRECSRKLDVDQLASVAGMSASTFHRAFKEITSESPIQYLKKVRLNKARDLIEREHMKVYIAADKVGYESSSQFSRDFKRFFGVSPAEMMRGAR
ncbi:AraC family transcriptional regulator [Desulfuromonas acetoxidans]|uniref:Transcriptional regulator, AraC family n=1 Tax=Desulfuromonas acetoxidans (strain DSM 684 / 11070) TaxID=281689 RepID=Q1JXM4_DESA6|nr:AraC family transcriptional regulator [Desulfuromonas acetoxidans]EAT14938.1 transcriptional regulator, AraC family [Desulfuromonas acetoxidans DSM 684]MBF0644718.1 AraC family transcriptional regulator [Desulfuromonas acetoxidans]NVD25281.1 AraC family transcriptional regulator [Desulfuromonas acetoxidans]NVE17315.1 AraC family transcriptional regulator [Desulfuromonas acetoxidans]